MSATTGGGRGGLRERGERNQAGQAGGAGDHDFAVHLFFPPREWWLTADVDRSWERVERKANRFVDGTVG